MAIAQSYISTLLNPGQNPNQSQEQLFDPSFNAPSYMRVADIYDRVNKNTGRMDAESSILTDIPMFIASSLISGGAQLYNILPSLGNLLGGEFELAGIDEVFQAIDDDLLKYYQGHQSSVDMVGFVLSSLVPGMAGIKGIRLLQSAGVVRLEAAMKSGRIGETVGKALGLLSPSREKHLAAAIKDLTSASGTTFSLTQRNLMLSIGAGFGQNLIEAAAFEIAVATTLHNSPILEGQDVGDFASHVIWGGLVFGAIGGVIDATRGVFKVRRAISGSAKDANPWTSWVEPATATPAEDKVAMYWAQAHDAPPIPTNLSKDRTSFLTTSTEKRKEELLTRVRENLSTLANGDQRLATQMFNTMRLAKPDDALKNIYGLMSVSKLADPMRAAKKLEAAHKRIAEGKSRLTGPGGKGPGDDEIINSIRVAYGKVHGENAGNFTIDKPVTVTLADTLTKHDVIEVTSTGVKVIRKKKNKKTGNVVVSVIKDIKFSTELRDHWSPMAATVEEANARHMWAQNISDLTSLFKKPKTKKGQPESVPIIEINASDIPLLERLYKDFDPNQPHIIHGEQGSRQGFASSDELLEFIVKQKELWANKLNKEYNQGIFLGSKEAVETKLRFLTGINFGVMSADDIALRFPEKLRMGKPLPNAFHLQISKGKTEIQLNEDTLLTVPLHELISTLKHEEGHKIFKVLLSIGGLPIKEGKAILREAKIASKKRRPNAWGTGKPRTKEEKEYRQYLNLEHELMADIFAYFSIYSDRLAAEAPAFAAAFGHLLNPIPKSVVDRYFARATQLTQEEIGSMVNMRVSRLSGVHSNQPTRDIFAMQSYAEEYTTSLVDAGLRDIKEGVIDLAREPTYMKMAYDISVVRDLDGNIIRGEALIRMHQKEYIANTDRAVALVLPKDFQRLLEIEEKHIDLANPLGAGPGFTGAASANPGSLASMVEYLGQVTTNVVKRFKDEARDTLTPSLTKLAQNKKAYLEWSVLNANIRSYEDHYVLNELGDALIPTVIAKFNKAIAEGKNPQPYILRSSKSPIEIPLVNEEVRELAKLHIEVNGETVEGARILNTAQGTQYRVDAKEFYPIPVDPRDYKFFAHVKDNSIAGSGETRTIFANSKEELGIMISSLKDEPSLVIRTKGEIEKYFKSIGEFDVDNVLSQTYLDSTLKRKGVSSPYFVTTDSAKITSDFLSWHLASKAQLVRGAIKVKYDKQFAELHTKGDAFTNLGTSKTGMASLVKHPEDIVENPYASYERTALGLRNTTEYPWWTNANRQVDAKLSEMYNKLTSTLEAAKTPAELSELNTILAEYGYKGARYTEEMALVVNHTAPRGALSGFVSKANGILATIVLRLDTLNAVNNTVGAQVLLGTEVRQIIRAIKSGDENAVGELTRLMEIKVPGTGDLIASPTKLIARAIRAFGSSDKAKMEFFKDNGYMTTISQQYKATLDQLTLTGKESVKQLDDKIGNAMSIVRKAADKGEVWTGNRLAEEFNRFVAAHVMKDITDIAVKHGMLTEKQSLAYINTFVNRTQGNYLASQRPMLFQGPIGQAIGLFPTYQFNLMQQLLRHVGEGVGKDSMTLLGLQGTIYGLNGLPGFNAINTHLIGTASGNQQHRDLYDVAYGIAGKEAGDWIMYGIASNMLLHPDLKINLYVRGDINPRHLTLVPTDPASVPIVQATAKFFKNLKTVTQKLSAGGDVWSTILQGIEHNGISRPLAGLAQTLEAFANDEGQSYSTSKRGNVIAANDFLSLTNMARMIGGKPLDEAIAIDSAFRFKTYAIKDSELRNVLGAAIKSSLIAGRSPTPEMIENFTQRYAELGGSQTEYNQWVLQLYKTANTSQANKLSQDLNSPFNRSMQKIMGGYELRDFQ